MANFDVKKVVDFYNARFQQYGPDIRSVGWGSKESQELRFKVLCEIADLKDASVLDLGCGFGDLYDYLKSRVDGFVYSGVDISQDLLNEARRRFSAVDFFCRDILREPFDQEFDYVLASGTLTFKCERHEEYVERMLAAMFKACRKGAAVNFMSTYVDHQLEKNFHFAPERALSFGNRLTKYVVLRQDYPLYEFTLYMYKDKA